MSGDQAAEFSRATGQEFRPSIVKLWAMLVVFAIMVPAGALVAYCWWFQVVVPSGRVLSARAGIAGLLAMPLGVFLALVMLALIASAKRLVVGNNCVQLLSKDTVVVHIPFQNVAQTGITGDQNAGTVVMVLRDRNDPQTLVPRSTKDRFQIQCMVYGKPPAHICQAVNRQLENFRAGRLMTS
jgi:hypothetical protein